MTPELLTGGLVFATILAALQALKRVGFLFDPATKKKHRAFSLVYNLLPLVLGVAAGLGGLVADASRWQDKLTAGLFLGLSVAKAFDIGKATKKVRDHGV